MSNSTNSIPVIFLAFANDRVDNTAYLRNLPVELDGIRTALQPAVKAGLCEVVERSNATIQNILDIFQDPYYKDRIAIFHYGGHANGYQLLLENLDGSHSSAHSEGLVSFFAKQKGLKLIFLNGCSSQQQALDLIESGIPAVVGTSQSINDDVATSLSLRFYKGIASGNAIEKAWLEAIDDVKIQKGTANMRDLFFDGMEEEESEVALPAMDRFPWEILFRDGAEIIKNWNLPEAVDNPLFGLPAAPITDLPEQPYRFLQRYDSSHTEIFFGRSYYIRELYNRAVDKNSAPIILFYGQSGVGKSSMLDAGLFPRLEQVCNVVYVRRDAEVGLLGTLQEALGMAYQAGMHQKHVRYQQQIQQLEAVKESLDDKAQAALELVIDQLKNEDAALDQEVEQEEVIEVASIKSNWKEKEEQTGKPLIILLDQVEEMYTKPNPDLPHEKDQALIEIMDVFGNPNDRPMGKIILSYRKEYNPEIEEAFKTLQLPREKVFLKKLEKRDIVEIIQGLMTTDRLRRRYRLTVEEELPYIIADDLLEDKDSPIAPVLQILLTKLWQLSEHEELRYFSIKKYQDLKRQGILMDDFFHEQMETVKRQYPSLAESGLALDILHYHTTRLGTANSHNLEELRERYGERQEKIDRMVATFKDLYLLSDAGVAATSLAHDTLAPIVQEEFRLSDKPGQRAALILQNKVVAYQQDPDNTYIDLDDLKVVESGAKGMRIWVGKEQELIEKSRQKRDKILAERRRNKMILFGLVGMIFLIIGMAMYFQNESNKEIERNFAEAIRQKELATRNEKEALKQQGIAEQKTEIANQKTLEATTSEAKAKQSAIAAALSELRALQAKDTAIKQRSIAEEKELESWRLVVATNVTKLAKTNPTKALKIGQLVYGLEPDKAPPSLLQMLGETMMKAEYSEEYALQYQQPKTPLSNNLLGFSSENVLDLRISPVNNYIIPTPYESEMSIWNAERKIIGTFKHANKIVSTSLSKDETQLLTAGEDYLVKLWDINGNVLDTFRHHKNRVMAVKFLDDGNMLSAADDSTLVMWNNKGELLMTYKGPNAYNYRTPKILTSPDQSQFITLWGTSSFHVIDRAGQLVAGLDYDASTIIQDIDISADGNYLVVLFENSEYAEIYDLKNDKQLFGVRGHTGAITKAHFSKDGEYLVTSSEDRTARLWKLNFESQVPEFKTSFQHDAGIADAIFVDNDKKILTAAADFSAKIWTINGDLLADLKGHESNVYKAVLANDGSFAITHSADNTLKMWNLTNTFSNKWKGHMPLISTAKFSPDGSKILTASADNTAKVWNTQGKLLHDLVWHNGLIEDAQFSSDGDYITLASADFNMSFWYIQGKSSRFITNYTHQNKVNSSTFSPEGSLVTASEDGTVAIIGDNILNPVLLNHANNAPVASATVSIDNKILTQTEKSISYWNVDGSLIWTKQASNNEILSSSFSPDGTLIATTSYLEAILWNTNGEQVAVLNHDNWIKYLHFSSDGSKIVTSSDDGTVKVWDTQGVLLMRYEVQNEYNWLPKSIFIDNDSKVFSIVNDKAFIIDLEGNLIHKLLGHEWYLTDVDVSADGQRILTASADGKVKIWNLEGKLQTTLQGHKAVINDIAITSDQARVVTASADKNLIIRNINNGVLEHYLMGHTSYVYDLDISSDDQKIASASADNTAMIWGIDGKQLATCKGHTSWVNSVNFSPDNQQIVTASADYSAKVWTVKGELLATLTGHNNAVQKAIYNREGNRIATCSVDGSVRLWDTQGSLINTFGNNVGSFYDVEFSPDGKYLVSVGAQGNGAPLAYLWAVDGSVTQVLKGHSSGINQVAFSRDGSKILTGANDNTLKLWNLEGKLLANMLGHKGSISHVSFSVDSKWAVSSSKDNTVRLWDVADGKTQGELLGEYKGHTDDVKKAIFSTYNDLFFSISLDGTTRYWLSPRYIAEDTENKTTNILTKQELLDLGFTEENIQFFIDKNWITFDKTAEISTY